MRFPRSLCLASLTLTLGALPTLAACGGAAQDAHAPTAGPQPTTPTVPVEPEPATVEEARARIEQAQAQLKDAFEARPIPTAPVSPSSSSGGRPTGTEPSSPTTDSACARACRAFSSLERAVAAVCRLAGETDAQCTNAKKILAENTTRVKSCACH